MKNIYARLEASFGHEKRLLIANCKSLQRPGIEPGPPAWQARILPLNQRCLTLAIVEEMFILKELKNFLA